MDKTINPIRELEANALAKWNESRKVKFWTLDEMPPGAPFLVQYKRPGYQFPCYWAGARMDWIQFQTAGTLEFVAAFAIGDIIDAINYMRTPPPLIMTASIKDA